MMNDRTRHGWLRALISLDPARCHAASLSLQSSPSSLSHRYLYRSDPQGHDGSAIYSGLIGPILVTAKGKSTNADEGHLRPKNVDKEFINVFFISDENNSPFVNRFEG